MPILNFRAETRTPEGSGIAAPERLTQMGPIVPVTIAVPGEVQRSYPEGGETPSDPIKGFALIDTGASMTCFDVHAAKKGGLPQIGVSRMASATHASQTVPTFAGQIIGPSLPIDVEQGMGANLPSQEPDLIALIDRDILQSAILIYNGADGHFSLSS